ncbi:hypothetical protein H744_1c0480 [Photobacterium gaetbulicola Gung47]|uniref:Galactosyltransferase C-terminal domain-containing protein n=1 Tax=Photobacterium gaetbulicola Gung47 TaxID=658445 RepID=A0A0C5WRB5_9GAMM|nr:galactosyltransferase-related protein [Photobacterium gaetbulicola]AJR05505.1 hypothetical protein H744_1c0480 [Photobacterium gaetbulicola Gung47]
MKDNLNYIARLAVVSSVTYYDKSAAVSPSLWQRVVPLHESILDEISSNRKDTRLCEDLQALALSFHDTDLMTKLVEHVHHSFLSDEGMLKRVWSKLLHLSDFGRILPHVGEFYYKLPKESDVNEQISLLSKHLLQHATERNGSVDDAKLLVVLSYRCPKNEPHRLRNLLSCICALYNQTISRNLFSIVAVEQDSESRTRDYVEPFVDKYIFAKNPGDYNYAWGRNVGVLHGFSCSRICFLDIDMLVPNDFLDNCLLQNEETSAVTVVPYDRLINLDSRSSSHAVHAVIADEVGTLGGRVRGQTMAEIYGGAIVVERETFFKINGQDERYRGWGDEDNDFYFRLYEISDVLRPNMVIYHMDHPRPEMRPNGKRINASLIGTRKNKDDVIGDLSLYAG